MPSALWPLVAIVALAVLAPPPALGQQPQTVHLIRRGGRQPAAWYADQARLWAARTEVAPGDPSAWHNLYLATEYGAGDDDGQRRDVGPALDVLLERMAQAVPESYQLPYLQARRLEFDSLPARRPLLKRAYERCPTCPDVLEDLALSEEIAGDTVAAARHWRALYDSGVIAPGLLEYNYNVLQSVDEGGILLTNGDNDTFPAWILQRVHGVRDDVLVLNLSLARALPRYLASILAAHKVGVDFSFLPADEPATFVAGLCSAAAAVRPDVPVFLGLTVAETYLAGVEPRLQVCGLAYAYAERPVDNMARLRRNLGQRFRLDHLEHDWYSEANIATGPIVGRLNSNYCYPALLLARQLDASTPDEDTFVTHHLASCDACRQYRLVLDRLQLAVADEVRHSRPRAEGRETLRAAVRAKRPRPSLWSTVWERVQVRVPAYQVALGAVAVAIALYAALPDGGRSLDCPGPAGGGHWPAAGPALTRADSYQVDQMLIRLDRQDRSPAIDTLISRYLSRQATAAVSARVTM